MVTEGSDVTEEQANEFGRSVGDIIADRLRSRKRNDKRGFTLRMSNIGKGARQLWYDKRYGNEENFPANTLVKFMFGDIIEQLVLFLADLSGHRVGARQDEVHLKGIKGHIDADIDGVTVDVKSASTHAFKKFADGTLEKDDPFGYIEQISGYAKARGTDGAFLAVDKQNGHIAYLPFTKEELAVFDVEARIDYVKQAVESDTIPERCHEDKPDGASGNRILDTNCSYCSHKHRCWADTNRGMGLRTFLYSQGPRFFTKVSREPQVYEVTI